MANLRNSMIRLLRTPVKTVLFLLLLAFTVALVSAGGSLWRLCSANMERFEDIFVTIGTVEQRPERTVENGVWSANKKEYRYYNSQIYGDTIPLSVLDLEGVEYLSGPEQRAYYSAVASEYELREPIEGMWFMMIVEASPVEDCIPSERVKMEMKDMLFAPYRVSMPTFYFCDHYEEHPQKLYKDKTYVMILDYNYAHDWVQAEDDNVYNKMEMVPLGGPYSTQTDQDGNRLPTDLTGAAVEEVTPGFWETERGKAWLSLCEEFRLYYESLPVTATEDLNLIMAFYAKEAYVAEGEVFSEEDYQQGNRVCLVSEGFARRNKLKVGDSVHLALRYANYAESAYGGGLLWGLNAAGENYEVFEEADYQIKGIYTTVAGGNRGYGYLLDRNEIFIPTASIKNSNENNIAAYGPMMGYTTAFRIENGKESLENFKAQWEEQGVGYVDISFYDGGFCELEEGLQSMERMSLLLLATGAVSAVCIVIFFCHLFITKQKKRTAIERCLGMKRRQCAVSLLTGILVIALTGCTAGAFAGQLFARRAAQQMLQTQEYDTRYSNGALQTESENREEIAYLTQPDVRVTTAAGGLVFLFTFTAALTGIYRNLREEPLQLLSTAEHNG